MTFLLVGGAFALGSCGYLGYRAACPSWDDPLDYFDDAPDAVLRRELWAEYGRQNRPWWCQGWSQAPTGGFKAIYARHGVVGADDEEFKDKTE